MVWISLEINCFHGRSTSVNDVYFDSAEDGIKWYDKNHDCHPQKHLCDYCNDRHKWVEKDGMFEKFVDHDGAGVFYQIIKLTHSPKEEYRDFKNNTQQPKAAIKTAAV